MFRGWFLNFMSRLGWVPRSYHQDLLDRMLDDFDEIERLKAELEKR